MSNERMYEPGRQRVQRSTWVADLLGPLQQADDRQRHELIAGVRQARPFPSAEQTAIATTLATSLGIYVTAQRLGRVYRSP